MSRRILFLLPLLFAACTSPDSGGNSSAACAGKCDGVEQAVTAFVCAPKDGQVECVSALPASYPVEVDVKLMTLDGSKLVTVSDGEQFVAPAGTKIMASVTFASAQRGLFHSDGDSDALDVLNQFVTLDGSATRRFDLPFDLWKVSLSGDAFMINGKLAAQTVKIAPWQTFLHDVPEVVRPGAELPSYEKQPAEILVLVARGQKQLQGTAEFCDLASGCTSDVAFVIEGPGSYVVSGHGLARPTTASPSPDMGEPAVGVDPSGTPDMLTSSDPDPSCGGEGQSRCNVNGDYVCDVGFVYINSACHVCGKDGQPRCNINGDYVCDEGFVYSSSLCHACGKDGQPRCYVNGNYVCDDGFVYSNSLCQACGKDGQPRCYVNGNYVCDDGFVYSNSLCQACGKDGQIRCYVNGDYVCDDGTIYLSSDSQCHACGKDGQIRCRVNGNLECDAGLVYSAADGRCHTP